LAKIASANAARLSLVDLGVETAAIDSKLKALSSMLPVPLTPLATVHAEQGRLASQAKVLQALATLKDRHAKADAARRARIDGLVAVRAQASADAEQLLKDTLLAADLHYDELARLRTAEQQEATASFSAALATLEAELVDLKRDDDRGVEEIEVSPEHVALASGSQGNAAQPGTPEGARQSSFGTPFGQCDFLDAAGKAEFLVFLALQKERMRKAADLVTDDDEFMGPPAQEAKSNARDLENGEVSDPKRSAK
jgi:hypothetical protein